MRIFICWSGTRSGTLAEALHDWLPKVIDGVEPFLSSRIDAGRRWQDEIAEALRRSGAGLVCLTPESLDSHWIHFEAGALANAVHRKPLFLYSHRVPPERLTDPLQAYQSKAATREDTWSIVQTIARAMKKDTSADGTLARTFEREWPSLARVISALDGVTIDAAIDNFRDLFNSQTFDEPMPECHDFNWIGRHKRLAGIEALLTRERPRVAALGEEHLLWLYDELLSSIKTYMTSLIRVLLAARDGRPARVDELSRLGPDVIESCELPRKHIQSLKERLLDAGGAPVLDAAVKFEKAGLSQRKQIAFGFELKIQAGDAPLSVADRRLALNSLWELDRVVAFQTLAATVRTPEEVRKLANHVQRERARAAAEGDGSLMALHCGLHALDDASRRLSDSGELGPVTPALLETVRDVESYIAANAGRQYGDEIMARLGSMRDRLIATPDA